MINKVGQFLKVSNIEFSKYFKNNEIYDKIILPKRATQGSAGYDFYLPDDIILEYGKSIIVPTGVKAIISPGWFLSIFPRSSLGFKYKVSLDNTVGIIDSDYSNALNEGHILVKITAYMEDKKPLILKKGERFVQGIFMAYGITIDDKVIEMRTGGIGSTSK